MATQPQPQPQWLESEEPSSESGWHDSHLRLQHQVEIQSRQIEQVLSRHQVPAGVSGGSVRPHWVSFDLVSQLSGGWGRLRRLTGELTGEIATALGVPEVRIERQNGTLRLAVKRYEPHPVDLLDLLDLVPEAHDLSLALGLDHQGHPVMLNLDQADLHNILIAGISGAGKSSLMRSVAISLALTCRQSLAQIAVIGLGSAPSGITTRPNPLYPVNYLPHLLFPVATEIDEAVEALAYLVEEVNYRADNNITSPALIILLDDADMLLRRVGGAVADQLAALLHAPAEAGVRVIIGASNPGLPDLAHMLQHNVDLRLVGRVADERAAHVATGHEKSYAQYLEGKGDFIAVSAAGIEPFHAAYIDDYDLHLTLTELHRASSPVLLAREMNDKPTLPPSWSLAGPQGFTYDGANDRAELEPDDRSGLSTIEIVVDPVDSQSGPGGHLTWLDHIDPPEPGQGLGLPLIVEEDEETSPDPGIGRYNEPEDSQQEDIIVNLPPAVTDESLPKIQSIGPHFPAVPPDASGESEDDPSPGTELPPSPAEPAQEEPGEPDNYEMLPFEEDLAPGQPEPVAEPVQSVEDTAHSEIDHSGRESTGMTGAIPNSVGPSPERAQTLWPLEPIYTDIDDDLWDAADSDEEDWRKRLH